MSQASTTVENDFIASLIVAELEESKWTFEVKS
jgi:hypothetical protein